MKPEKRQLIHDLLDDGNRREATLFAGAQILRRRRRWRIARRGLASLAIVAAAVFWIEQQRLEHQPLQAATPAPRVNGPSRPQALTDNELLALFPNTPVGLATLADGKKRLIFPRPGDEQKLVTRL